MEPRREGTLPRWSRLQRLNPSGAYPGGFFFPPCGRPLDDLNAACCALADPDLRVTRTPGVGIDVPEGASMATAGELDRMSTRARAF
jgi:hypothetical protein